MTLFVCCRTTITSLTISITWFVVKLLVLTPVNVMEEPKLENSNVTTPTLLPSKHILVEKTSKRRVSMVTGEKTLKIG